MCLGTVSFEIVRPALRTFSVRYLHAYIQFNSLTYQAGLIFLVFACAVPCMFGPDL